jgi:serine/threonine protein kinase
MSRVCSSSGHVYVAKTLSTGRKVAIREMDLFHSPPRKGFVVTEIQVMKEFQHPNVMVFLESYLVENHELWIVMEYMEGGRLTDIIEQNTLEEDQISRICLEVGFLLSRFWECGMMMMVILIEMFCLVHLDLQGHWIFA